MATSTDEIVLYDLPTKKPDCGCWSPNVWKSRIVLNFKNIPYRTELLLHPEIGPTLSALGIPPNAPLPPGAPGGPVSRYTLPAVQFPDGTAAMDSDKIVTVLEERYPEPSLHLENDLHNKLMPVLGRALAPLMYAVFPRIRDDILRPEAVPFWVMQREAKYGCSMEEATRKGGGEKAWQNAQPGFAALRNFMREHKIDEGPFVEGSQVSYVDVVLASLAESFQRIGEDLYERLCENVPNLKPLHEACRPWLKKDS